MHILAFLDLDDTLFQTRAKCPPGPLVPAAYGHDGTPRSFMSETQQRFAAWLGDTTTVVPTTGRNLAALRRVRLRWSAGSLVTPAIINHGGSIVRGDDTPDPGWQNYVDDVLAKTRDALASVFAELTEATSDSGVGVREIGDFGRTLYLVVKHPDADLDAVEAVREEAEALVDDVAPNALRVIANGNNVAVVPRGISKSAAVDYLLERYRRDGPLLSLGIGDSLSDAGFLSRCDFAVTPTQSQLWQMVVSQNVLENSNEDNEGGRMWSGVPFDD